LQSLKPKPQAQELSLYEKAESVKALWDQLVMAYHKRDVGFVTEIPLRIVQDWLVKEGIALDRDKAKMVMVNEIGALRLEG
jgi:hypothetical protein